VILHIVLDRDGGSAEFPLLVLRPYLPASAWELAQGRMGAPSRSGTFPLAEGEVDSFLGAAGEIRWERRWARHCREAQRVGEQEAMHRAFFVALGYGRNRASFRELARLVPAARSAGRSAGEVRGMLEDAARRVGIWRRAGVRPANRPERRLDAAASLLARGTILEVMRSALGEHAERALADADEGRIRSAIGELRRIGGLGERMAAGIVLHAVLPGFGKEAVNALRRHRARWRSSREEEGRSLLGPSFGPSRELTVLQQMGLLELREAQIGLAAGGGGC